MSGTSATSSIVSIRLPNEIREIIERSIASENTGSQSIPDYIRQAAIRHAVRHLPAAQRKTLIDKHILKIGVMQ